MKREQIAGPALIAGTVLIVLHQIAFGGRVPSQHPDVLGFWLPMYCFLGENLAAGHIPAWNPHVMAGVPFAADPQSGWMYLPAMALFTALPCGAAIRWIIVLQPILGGLGLYAFLRSEGLSRPAATLGGLGLALPLASSRLGLFLPFPSSLAWTAVVLAACSLYFRQRTWTRRVVWLGLFALAWGQLAAAYLAHGLVIGTGALVAYVGARLWRQRESGADEQPVGVAALLLIPAALSINLAFLLPRLAYLPRSSFAMANEALSRPSGLPPVWPLKLAVPPGAYLGAAVLLLIPLAFRSSQYRRIVIAFCVYALVFYVAGLDVVASNLSGLIDGVPILGLYAHFPGRLGLALLLALPILGAVGLDAWQESGHRRDLGVAGLIPLIWIGIPLALGVHESGLFLLYGSTLVVLNLLLTARRRPRLLALIPVLAAVELGVNGIGGLAPRGLLGSGFLASRAERETADPLGAVRAGWLVPLRTADVDPFRYQTPGAIARALQRMDDGRYISVAPNLALGRWYLTAQAPSDWPLLASQRSMLFGLEEVQGYNPVQLGRYWEFVRSVVPGPLEYNAAVLPHPPPVAFDLLQIDFIVQSAEIIPAPPLSELTREGEWALFRSSPDPRPRASLVSSWSVLSDADDVQSSVTAPGFDPTREVLLEADPGLGPSPPPTRRTRGTVSYRQHDAQLATITVQSSAPAVVLIRTPYDPNWHAKVNGRPAPLLAADYVAQAVPVPAGKHRIELAYDDPWIGYGLLGSGMALVVLLILAVVVRNRPIAAGNVTEARSER